jgi:hypothetical protein
MSLRTIVMLLLGLLPAWLGPEQAAPAEKVNAKTWVGRYQEIEDALRTEECLNMQVFPGVYVSRCTFRSGGPVARMAWRPLRSGPDRGFRESYKTEIAAYELDKLLKMDMVPPTVERHIQGTVGGAQLWVEKIVDATGPGPTDAESRAHWDAQLVRMAMFDNLIGNRERNRATMLRDDAWNLILIDHSRAFGPGAELRHKMVRIDDEYWRKIEALTRSQLDAALRAWLDASAIGAILERRDAMRAEIKLLRR